jgi:hypothetical protein
MTREAGFRWGLSTAMATRLAPGRQDASWTLVVKPSSATRLSLSYDHTPGCGNLAHPPGQPYPAVPDLVRAALIAPIWTASRTHMMIGMMKTGDDLAEWW